jgi:hypothetical protein
MATVIRLLLSITALLLWCAQPAAQSNTLSMPKRFANSVEGGEQLVTDLSLEYRTAFGQLTRQYGLELRQNGQDAAYSVSGVLVRSANTFQLIVDVHSFNEEVVFSERLRFDQLSGISSYELEQMVNPSVIAILKEIRSIYSGSIFEEMEDLYKQFEEKCQLAQESLDPRDIMEVLRLVEAFRRLKVKIDAEFSNPQFGDWINRYDQQIAQQLNQLSRLLILEDINQLNQRYRLHNVKDELPSKIRNRKQVAEKAQELKKLAERAKDEEDVAFAKKLLERAYRTLQSLYRELGDQQKVSLYEELLQTTTNP